MNDLGRLRETIVKSYSMSELKVLCSDIGVDFEELAGEDKALKAQELIQYLDRRQQLSILITYCSKTRPNVQWQNLIDDSDMPSGQPISKVGTSSTSEPARVVPSCRMRHKAVIIVVAVMIIMVVIASFTSYLANRWTIEATKIAAANLTYTPIPLQSTDTPHPVYAPISTGSPTRSSLASTSSPTSTLKSTPTPPPMPSLTPVSIMSDQVVTDSFNTGQLDPSFWQPPSDSTIVFVQDGALILRVTPLQVLNGAEATLSVSPQARPIREIRLTMTMVSFERNGEGGVGARAFMTDGLDHYISLTHDQINAAIELGMCKQQKCAGNYDEYRHPDSAHVKEGVPVRMKFVWDGSTVALYVDGIKRAIAPAKDTPIADFRFSLFASSGGAFEVKVDDVSIRYGVP